ncbi:sensor histidine kinase [Clostridium hydrogenum]|uniref:sensor histidine kinase n=1 Tax=Clostridium hydrogenum TaxID=2855764 RepID=UPI001F25C32B|nr:sensor histidine kinase [Clostridium hydrogenum]
MSFVVMSIYLDRKNRVLNSNIEYIIFVSLFMFCIFLILDYLIKNRHIKKLLKAQCSEDKTPILPKAVEYKDELYTNIINDIYKSSVEAIRNVEAEFMENKEFMEAWVHEVKTPITTMRLLLDSNEEDIDSYKEEVEKIDEYVEKVLYYSRSDNFSKDYIISEVSLETVVKESIKKQAIVFIKKHIILKQEVDESFKIDSDKKWLLFIIDQVLSNALKYTDKGGCIGFRTAENDKERLLIIEDDGVGIKSEDLNRIFTKTFTGANGRNENLKATGLGLYLSQKLSKKLGHSITIESEFSKGTRVYVHFPKWCDYYNITQM